MKKNIIWLLSVLAIVLSLSMFYSSAWNARKALTQEYNRGVQYYESGHYAEAMEIFNKLRGWGNCVEISPEDYYNMAVEKLSAEKGNSILECPNCGFCIVVKGE